jgi:hypothetical protein
MSMADADGFARLVFVLLMRGIVMLFVLSQTQTVVPSYHTGLINLG